MEVIVKYIDGTEKTVYSGDLISCMRKQADYVKKAQKDNSILNLTRVGKF